VFKERRCINTGWATLLISHGNKAFQLRARA
jgi:hypothetical protein